MPINRKCSNGVVLFRKMKISPSKNSSPCVKPNSFYKLHLHQEKAVSNNLKG